MTSWNSSNVICSFSSWLLEQTIESALKRDWNCSKFNKAIQNAYTNPYPHIPVFVCGWLAYKTKFHIFGSLKYNTIPSARPKSDHSLYSLSLGHVLFLSDFLESNQSGLVMGIWALGSLFSFIQDFVTKPESTLQQVECAGLKCGHLFSMELSSALHSESPYLSPQMRWCITSRINTLTSAQWDSNARTATDIWWCTWLEAFTGNKVHMWGHTHTYTHTSFHHFRGHYIDLHLFPGGVP